jgi:hypothetical protein
VACLQGGRPAAVFYFFGHPTLSAYDVIQASSGNLNYGSMVSVSTSKAEERKL